MHDCIPPSIYQSQQRRHENTIRPPGHKSKKKHRLWFVNVDLGLLDLPKDVFGLPPKTDDGTMQGTAIAVAKAVALYFKKFLREILLPGPASK